MTNSRPTGEFTAALRAGRATQGGWAVCPEHGREDLLGLRPARAAVAPADLAHHDGRPKRLLGAPVGGIKRGVAQEREER